MGKDLTVYALITLTSCFSTVLPQIVAPNNTLICRLCNRAATLSGCNKLVTCDATLEECYTDEILTEYGTLVHNAGCRAKSVCGHASIGGLGRRRRSENVTCTSCCNYENDCNKRMCGLRDSTHQGQCYNCDHSTSDQSEVRDPEHCVTLTTCQPNEVCYARQSDVAGVDTFFYGCMNKLQCSIITKFNYEDYRRCVLNDTSLLPSGATWYEACGTHRRATALCTACCADSLCNYGTCEQLNLRIFHLAAAGLWDLHTMKLIH